MIFITGTIRNAVKLAELDNKWQQKKKSGGKAFNKELSPQEKQIKQYEEDLKKMRENDKMASIGTKLKSGAGLTSDEIEYLQKNNPQMYREYMEIKNEKEAYERQLKSCRTKDDVERVKIQKLGRFMAESKSVVNNPNIPEGKKLAMVEKILMKVMGDQKVYMKFVESGAYKALPTDEELAEEKKEKTEEMTGETAEEAVNQPEEEIRPPEEASQPEEARPPEEANQPEKVRPPEEANQPEEARPSEEASQPREEEPSEKTEEKLSRETKRPHKKVIGQRQQGVKIPVQPAADLEFDAVKTELREYLRSHRSSGYGLEILTVNTD